MWMHNQFINQIIHTGNKFTTFIMLCSMFNIIDVNWTIHTFMTFTKLQCFPYGALRRTTDNFFPIHINHLFIDVSLSFQSASHSFSVLAPRDGVMTYPIIEVLRESNSSCGYYAHRATVTLIDHIQGERRALARALKGLPCSHFLSHSHSLQSFAGNRDTRPACHR